MTAAMPAPSIANSSGTSATQAKGANPSFGNAAASRVPLRTHSPARFSGVIASRPRGVSERAIVSGARTLPGRARRVRLRGRDPPDLCETFCRPLFPSLPMCHSETCFLRNPEFVSRLNTRFTPAQAGDDAWPRHYMVQRLTNALTYVSRQRVTIDVYTF